MKKTKLRVIALSLACIMVLAVGNFIFAAGEVAGLVWTKGGAPNPLTVETENEVSYYKTGGITASYQSPYCNIYSEVKQILGQREEAEIEVSFDYFVTFKAEAEKTASAQVVMRAGDVSDAAKAIAKEEFSTLYEGTIFRKVDAVNIMSTSFSNSSVTFKETWQTFSSIIKVTQADLSDGLWEKWELCFNSIKDFENIASIGVKNTQLKDVTPIVIPEGTLQWNQGTADKITVGKEQEDIVFVSEGITAAWKSPFCDIYSVVKQILGQKDAAAVQVSFEYAADFGAAAEKTADAKIAMRAGGLSEEAKTIPQEEFSTIYSGKLFRKVDSANIMSTSFENAGITLREEWQTFSSVITVTQADLSEGLWSNWNLCFNSIGNIDNIERIRVKNTKVEIGTIDVKPESPEDAIVWEKGLAETITSETVGEEIIYTAEGITASYKSPTADIYGKIKELLGTKHSEYLTIEFEYLASFQEGKEKNADGKIMLRAGGISEEVNQTDKEAFSSIYPGTLFKKIDAVNIVCSDGIVNNSVVFREQWQTFSSTIKVTQQDLSEGLWTQWNLCFSNISNFENLESISVKNTRIAIGQQEINSSLEWKKGYAGGLEKMSEDGKEFYRATGIEATYHAPTCDIFQVVKDLVGQKEKAYIKITFQCRISGTPSSATLILRAGNLGKAVSDATPESFASVYGGTLFKKIDSSNVLTNDLFEGKLKLDENWQTVSTVLEIKQSDLNSNLWGAWNLCLSNIEGFEDIAFIDFTAVTVEETSSSADSGDAGIGLLAFAAVLSAGMLIVCVRRRRRRV